MQNVKQFSVVDVETTGFGKSDKICEIAIVNISPETFEIIDEFETLVNPKRDIGAVHVHRITASMVAGAPTFEEIASGVAARLDRSVLIAHNLSFDQRMIEYEFDRLNATFNPGSGICTLNLSGEKLALAAKRFGIKHENQHSALADARAAASLFKLLFEENEYEKEISPMHIKKLNAPPCGDVVVRGAIFEKMKKKSLIEQICEHTRFPTTESNILQYLNLVNSVLADLTVDSDEKKQIDKLVEALDLRPHDVEWANEVYLQTLISGAKRDGIITKKEKKIMDTVAEMLKVPHQKIPSVTEQFVCAKYAEGTRVCFTGAAMGPDWEPIRREKFLEPEAAKRGLQPVQSVTKKGCDLVVAQDVHSESSKARKARAYGIELVSVEDFLATLGL